MIRPAHATSTRYFGHGPAAPARAQEAFRRAMKLKRMPLIYFILMMPLSGLRHIAASRAHEKRSICRRRAERGAMRVIANKVYELFQEQRSTFPAPHATMLKPLQGEMLLSRRRIFDAVLRHLLF